MIVSVAPDGDTSSSAPSSDSPRETYMNRSPSGSQLGNCTRHTPRVESAAITTSGSPPPAGTR